MRSIFTVPLIVIALSNSACSTDKTCEELFHESFTGTATCSFEDGQSYQGEFKDGFSHGEGSSTLPDGIKYEGQWEKGAPHGFGVAMFPDGKQYKGEFKRSLRHGYGVMLDQDGAVTQEGYWGNDNFISE